MTDQSRASKNAPSASTTTAAGQPSPRTGRLQVVLLGPDEFHALHDLPARGAVRIGRGGENEINLPDRAVSRHHAQIHVRADSTFAIEDLGSANGTHVARGKLAAGATASLAVGEAVFLGKTVAFIQSARSSFAALPTQSSCTFEGELTHRCERERSKTHAFTLLLVEVLNGFAHDRVQELAERHLLPSGSWATRDACQYAAIIPAGPEGSSNLAAHPFVLGLRDLWPSVAYAEVGFPNDETSAHGLLLKAGSRLSALAMDVRDHLVFGDPRMRRLYELAKRAAAGSLNVLILGETGTGKDVMARTIHRYSLRADEAFQRIECAALTESLAESELFGHERGAFTGAVKAKSGLIEVADGGTVFLDEVGELPLRVQAKLLHVLETRQVTRVSAVTGRTVDVRFVAATNRNLADDSSQGLFRKDLYYRLNGLSIGIPPLRERPREILPLARALLREACNKVGRGSIPELTPGSVASLLSYRWPGNVRELRNVVERALLLNPTTTIDAQHLVFDADPAIPDGHPPVAAALESKGSGPSRSSNSDDEKLRIEHALATCGGNQSRAAKMLGMARSTLVLRLDALGIVRPRKTKSDPSRK